MSRPILSELILYPIKSCAGISLQQATVTPAGLMTENIYDREWMVVDADGNFLSQRTHPKMASIHPRLRMDMLEVRSRGMLPLYIPLGLPAPEEEKTIEVQIWGDRVLAYDCDELTATWFSNALGTPCRLVRFHPSAERVADRAWTKGAEAPTLFPDGFPFLILSEESLHDLNLKLAAAQRPMLSMERFRPNIVLKGIPAFEEDFTGHFKLGAAVLQPVKPCPRCQIPAVDQQTGEVGPDPMDILQTYRADARLNGAITFGMNAILAAGEETTVRVGEEVELELAFPEDRAKS